MEILKIGSKEYKLRLTTKTCIEIEKRLGTNPLNVFMEAQSKMPKIEDLMIILHGCMTSLNNGISIDSVYKIYDEWCQEDGSILKLVELLVKVFEDGGFIPKDSKNLKK